MKILHASLLKLLLAPSATTALRAFLTVRPQSRGHLPPSNTFVAQRRGTTLQRPWISSLHGNSNRDTDEETETTQTRVELKMENLYMEWTVEDDTKLYEQMKVQPAKSLPQIAAVLGRGLRGVESRMARLNDVESQAYRRLFVRADRHVDDDNEIIMGGKDGGTESKKNQSLTPVGEVLRRIKWDYGLDPTDFHVEYFDRVEDEILSSPFAAKNDSVSGREELFVFAIPEHRISAIKYREQVVWDKQKRLDCVFGSMNGNGNTIDQVMEEYDEWKRQKDEYDQYNAQRQRDMAQRIKSVLGEHLFASLKDISATLQNKSRTGKMELPRDVEDYVRDALGLFRKARMVHGSGMDGMDERNEMGIGNPNVPKTDEESLDLFSDLVGLLPDDQLRERILLQIHKQVMFLDPSRATIGRGSGADGQNQKEVQTLKEDDLTEQFVRGSGAGGQKINKTANKVVLVHEPTQLRVECQETRSLTQNRKIARKRLALKIDEYWNGSESKTQQKIAKKVNKKQRTRARNKARTRQRLKNKEEEAGKAGANNDNAGSVMSGGSEGDDW